jgi:hypothetical protein
MTQSIVPPVPLSVSQAAAVEAVASKCKLLCFISAEALAKVDAFVDSQLKALDASPTGDNLTATERSVALASAGRFGGAAGAVALSAFKAKARADAAFVAGIPRDKVILLKCMVGDDVGKIADAWRAQTAPAKAARR